MTNTYVVRIDLPGIDADSPEDAAREALVMLRAREQASWVAEVAEDTDQDLALGLEDSTMVDVRVSKEGTVSAAPQGERT